MRKLASILLLAILLFNWVGYRLVTGILLEQADQQLQASLEKNRYSDDELVEIRVPLNLPYQTDWKEFQSYDGAINVQGVDYRYVKRKVEKGQLVLLCLPNHSKTHLATARDQFFMLVNDLQHNGHSRSADKSVALIKSPITDYWQQLSTISVTPPTIVFTDYILPAAPGCLQGFADSLIQPPDSSC